MLHPTVHSGWPTNIPAGASSSSGRAHRCAKRCCISQGRRKRSHFRGHLPHRCDPARSNGGKQSLVLTATFFRAGFADELGVSPSSYVDDGAALSRHPVTFCGLSSSPRRRRSQAFSEIVVLWKSAAALGSRFYSTLVSAPSTPPLSALFQMSCTHIPTPNSTSVLVFSCIRPHAPLLPPFPRAYRGETIALQRLH